MSGFFTELIIADKSSFCAYPQISFFFSKGIYQITYQGRIVINTFPDREEFFTAVTKIIYSAFEGPDPYIIQPVFIKAKNRIVA